MSKPILVNTSPVEMKEIINSFNDRIKELETTVNALKANNLDQFKVTYTTTPGDGDTLEYDNGLSAWTNVSGSVIE